MRYKLLISVLAVLAVIFISASISTAAIEYRPIKIAINKYTTITINLPNEVPDFSGNDWLKQTMAYSGSLWYLRIFCPETEWRGLHNNPYMHFYDILILDDTILAMRRYYIGRPTCWLYKDGIPEIITEEAYEGLIKHYSTANIT